MTRFSTIILALACVLQSACKRDAAPAASAKSLTVFCAANLKKPVEAIAEDYRKETGVQVSLQYGGTGTLLTQLQVAKQGDIFIAADDDSIATARSKNLVKEVLPLVVQHPVIAVAKGNPKAIHGIADLLKDDVKLSLPDAGAASIGKVTKKLLGAQWDALAKKATVTKPTVTEVAADIQLHTVDAGIVWDATVSQFKDLEAVTAPEISKHGEHASAALLNVCTQPQEALRFARYLAAPEKGGEVFKKSGFEPAGGDKWAAKPEMILYSGGVNRLAIEKLVQQFADREGAAVTTVFNGCGILCASMKTMGDSSNPKFPDAYYACDVCFVPPVAKYFPEAVLLTETDIVIAVPKGNPKNVKTLADLAQPGLRVGLCNAEQSTLGYMTRAMLKSSNVYDSVMKNVAVQVPTADFLINQMRASALDAAVVYLVNVKPQAAHIEAISLPADKAKAVQPFSVRVDSANRELSKRLLAFLREHKANFEEAGFAWKGEEAPVKSSDLKIPDYLKQQ